MSILSIGKAWEESVVFVKREGKLLFPVALALIALPFVIALETFPATFFNHVPTSAQPLPPLPAGAVLAMVIAGLLAVIGALAIYVLALRPGTSVGEALQLAVRRTPILVGAGVLIGLALTVLVMLLSVIGAAFVMVGGKTVLTLMSALIIVALAYVSARFLLLNVVVVDTDLGVWPAIRQSWQVTAGQMSRLFGFVALFMVLLIVVQSAAQAVFGVLGGVVGGPDLARLLGGLASASAGAVIQVYFLVMTARIYRQLRAPE